MICKSCNKKITYDLVDLGSSPIANNYLKNQNEAETWYPLKVSICDKCWLLQTAHNLKSKLIFNKDYPYFSVFPKVFWIIQVIMLIDVYEKFLKNKKKIKF